VIIIYNSFNKKKIYISLKYFHRASIIIYPIKKGLPLIVIKNMKKKFQKCNNLNKKTIIKHLLLSEIKTKI
jgi:hypothetical protein